MGWLIAVLVIASAAECFLAHWEKVPPARLYRQWTGAFMLAFSISMAVWYFIIHSGTTPSP